MAHSFPPPQAHPDIPAGPPPLKHHPSTYQHRPPLPPVPSDYRAQAAAEQLERRSQPPPPSLYTPFALTSDNLRRIDYLNASSTVPHPQSFYRHPPPPPHHHYSHPPPPPRSLSAVPHRNPSHPIHPYHLPPHPPPPHLSRTPSHNNISSPYHQSYLPASVSQLLSFPSQKYSPASEPPSPTALGPQPAPIALPVIDIDLLTNLYQNHFKLNPDSTAQIDWASKVFKFIERSQGLESKSSSPITPTFPLSASKPPQKTFTISDPILVKYTDIALKVVIQAADDNPTLPNGGAQALYLRGDLHSTGAFPSYRPKDSKQAFRDFEAAAQLGHHLAWFRIGREYETCEDWDRAVSAYQQGLSFEECACVYRLGMSYLQGEMNLSVDIAQAVGFLKKAAQLANEETPQPAYVYGMILAGEFESLPQIPHDILPLNLSESKFMIEKAAYLGFAPAQYKMGWCYEYSQLTCPFDPLLSVEYYSLASKQGEGEADMALSKWFLCGAEGHFGPNESLAVNFAEKASQKGLGSAMFAMGYYLEVGIGGRQDSKAAVEWYQRAWEKTGNEDARDRLANLGDGGIMLSRQEHEQHLDQKLVRKHTLAAQRNPVDQLKPSSGLRRRETMKKVEEARLSQVGTTSNNLSSPHTLSGPPSPSQPCSTTPNSSSPYSTTRIKNLPMPTPDLRQPNGRWTGATWSQPATPTTPTSSLPRPSLDPNSVESSAQKPPEGRAPNNPRMVNRLNGYQLTDDGPLPASSQSGPPRSVSARRRVDHITTSQPSSTASKTQFNSFAEMGIQTAKAKKTEECIIV